MERRRPPAEQGDDSAGSLRRAGASGRKAWLLVLGAVGAAVAAFFVAWPFWRAGEMPQRPAARRDSEKPQAGSQRPGGEKPPPGPETSSPAPAPPDSPDLLREEAFRVADRLIRDVPDRPEPIALLALAHSTFGNSAEAVECWQRCLQLDSDFAGAYDGMGRIALHTGDFEEAAAHFRKALAMAPKLPEIRPLLADALMNLGKPEEAVAVLEEDLELFPQHAQSLFELGRAYLQLNEHEKAGESLRAAVEIDAGLAEAYYCLANVSVRLGQKDEARKYREKFAELKAASQEVTDGRRPAVYRPERVREAVASIHLAAGNLYARRQIAARAEEHWRRTATLDPADVASRHQLALAYLQSRRTREALEVLGQLRKIEPENAIHCLNTGFVHARCGQFDAAEDALRAACKLAPQSPAGFLALAQLYLETNSKLPQARVLAQTAVDLEATASGYFVLGVACDRSGDAAGALAAIEKAVQMDPDNAEYQRMHQRVKNKR